jgi:hypothetical protein
MEEWQQQEQKKAAEDVVASLFGELTNTNMRYAIDEINHEEWCEAMRTLQRRLNIFGLGIDRPERFMKPGGRI